MNTEVYWWLLSLHWDYILLTRDGDKHLSLLHPPVQPVVLERQMTYFTPHWIYHTPSQCYLCDSDENSTLQAVLVGYIYATSRILAYFILHVLSVLLFTTMNFYTLWILLVNRVIEHWIVYTCYCKHCLGSQECKQFYKWLAHSESLMITK